jgi:DNA-binding XRE family transcriptional regulator
MTNSLANLRKKVNPKVLAAAEKKAQKILASMPLQELRHARQLSQEQLADALHIKQASISKLERRTDMYISTLRNFIRAMGGELEINAIFPDGIVSIDQFHKLSDAALYR